MHSMKCWSCALKHIAGALSYGKEILSGHTYGAELDHRPDLIGELVNCEHHAELLSSTLFDVVSSLRKQLQDRHGICSADDLETLRSLYLTIERMETASEQEQQSIQKELSLLNNTEPLNISFQDIRRKTLDEYQGNPEILDLVIIGVDNPDWFEFQYQSIQRHANGYRRLIVVQPTVDLTAYSDISIIPHSLYQLCQSAELSDTFICMNGHQALLHDYTLQQLPPTYAQHITPLFRTVRADLKQIYEAASDYDTFMPQPVDKALFVQYMSNDLPAFPLSYYFAKKQENRIYDTAALGSYIDRPICCSTRASLKHRPFVSWQNDTQFVNVRTFAIEQRMIQL